MAQKQERNWVAIITMFFIFGMISFVTNMAAPFGNIWGFKYEWAGMAGNLMNFLAYLFMGIPAGNMLIKFGYKKTALIALAVGFIGLGIQWLSSKVGADVAVCEIAGQICSLNLFIYLLGALVCGFCVCMLNTVVNPMLNLLGGGGNSGNQLIQAGGTINSLTGTLTPMLVGVLIGTLTKNTTMAEVKPIVTAYILDGEKRLMSYGEQRLMLPKGIELVEISLSSLDFSHASQVQFAYRLNDDGEWMELSEGEHVMKFAHLPSGESQLQVRATDAYGRWSIPTTVLTLVRPATWYEHTWLWALMAMVLLAGSYYLMKRKKEIVQEQRLQEPAVEEESHKLLIADQEFLDKAVAAVAAHMIDSDYSVDVLASDLCMSRANLHRKMRAIIGQTPTDFIRNQRLERAAHLLRTTSHSVNEISNLVGFSYASYFTKCFKEKYGVLPKDYVK